MNLRELLESQPNDHGNRQAAYQKLKDLFAGLTDYLESNLSFIIDLGHPKFDGNSVAYKDTAGDMSYLTVTGRFHIENIVYDQDYLQPTAGGSLILGTPHSKKILKELHDAISTFFKSKDIHLTWSPSTGHYNDHWVTVAQFTLMRFEKTPRLKSWGHGSGSGTMNPRDAFLSRPGEIARQRRVATSAYSDTFGGDSSNYTR